MKRVIFLATISMVCFSSLVFANISEVKTAIINKDYAGAKNISEEILTFVVVEKGLANEARYYLAVSELNLREFLSAENNFKIVIDAKPQKQLRDKCWLGLFDVYYLQGHYSKAYSIISMMIKKSPKSAYLSMAYLKAAKANLKLAQWSRASEYLNNITSHFPNSLEAHLAKQLLEEEQYFAVQIGAFVDQDRAQKLVEELKLKKEYAYVVETQDRNNDSFYRVRVGQLTKLDEAKRLQSKLSKEGYPTRIYP